MKNYSREEIEEAKKKLPGPVSDFMYSPTLTTVYLGIQKKHGLNLRQLDLFVHAATLVLAGLEPESALEPRLHRDVPELKSEVLRELIVDINDRVFKEARRRLRENV